MADRKTEIRIPARGTRGARMPSGPIYRAVTRPWFNREVKRLEDPRATEQARFMGFPIGLVTTVGAKTGKEHKHVLGVFPDGDDVWLLVASNGGARSHPHWFVNIAKNHDKVWLQVAGRRMRVHVESLQGKQREEAYARVAAVGKTYGGYPKKTDREIPVLRLTPAE
jgi:deazaflavin-dependent oxidoreductase (nitroreductase family)